MKTNRTLLAVALWLSFASSAGAIGFVGDVGGPSERGVASKGGRKMSIDSRLIEKAGQPGKEGYSQVGEWLARNMDVGNHLDLPAINACGKRLLIDLFEATDRTNNMLKRENSVGFVVESKGMGVAAAFDGGKFIGFYESPTAKGGKSVLSEIVKSATPDGKVSPGEANAVASALVETIMKSPERKNVIATYPDGTKLFQAEAPDVGMMARWRVDTKEFVDFQKYHPDGKTGPEMAKAGKAGMVASTLDRLQQFKKTVSEYFKTDKQPMRISEIQSPETLLTDTQGEIGNLGSKIPEAVRQSVIKEAQSFQGSPKYPGVIIMMQLLLRKVH